MILQGSASLRIAAGSLVAALAAGACSSDDDETIRVAAAASLTDVMSRLADAYESSSGIAVELNVGASSALALQIEEGAPVDVFAAADIEIVETLRDRTDGIGDPIVFATNDVVVAVAVDEDAPVDGIADFADEDLLLGACAPQVPCGGYAARVFRLAGIDPALDTEETDVRSLAAKIASGDLDAGIIYRTDVAASDSLRAIDLPAEVAIEATYGVAVVDPNGSDAPDGQGFAEFLVSDVAREILVAEGFGLP